MQDFAPAPDERPYVTRKQAAQAVDISERQLYRYIRAERYSPPAILDALRSGELKSMADANAVDRWPEDCQVAALELVRRGQYRTLKRAIQHVDAGRTLEFAGVELEPDEDADDLLSGLRRARREELAADVTAAAQAWLEAYEGAPRDWDEPMLALAAACQLWREHWLNQHR